MNSHSNERRNVALYARVSTEEQSRDGKVSLNVQLESLRKWAAENGHTVVKEYVDPGFSGRTDKRPALQAMLNDAPSGTFNLVAVAKLDRLFRHTGKLHSSLEYLHQHGIGFTPLDHADLNTSTAAGGLVLGMLGSVAQFESQRIGERVKEARAKMKEQRRWSGSQAPYGYRWNRTANQFEIVEAEAAAVRRLFELYAGGMGLTRVACEMNESGYRRRPRRHGGPDKGGIWYMEPIRIILTGAKYAGMDPDYTYPAIIDRETFEVVQRKLKTARKVLRNPGVWLLQGYLVCGLCGRRLSSKMGRRGIRRYRCLGRTKPYHLDGSCKCGLPSVRADCLETEVWRRFSEAVNDSDLLREAIERGLARLEGKHAGDGVTAICNQLEDLKARKARVWTLFEDGGMPKDRMMARIRELEAEEAGLRERLTALEPAGGQDAAALREFVRTARLLLAKSIKVNPWGVSIGDESFSLDVTDSMQGYEPANLAALSEHLIEGTGPLIQVRCEMNRIGSELQTRQRRLLELFQVKVEVYPDYIYVRGLVPLQGGHEQKSGDRISFKAIPPGWPLSV